MSRGLSLRSMVSGRSMFPGLAAALDPDFGALASAKRLDDYYIPTRYPDGLPGDIPSRYYNDEE